MRTLRYTLILSGILALLVWSLYGFFLWDLGVRNDRINALKTETEHYKEHYSEVKGIVSFLEKEKKRLEETNDLFLKRKDSEIVSFITEIEELGSKTGASLELFGLSKEERKGNVFLNANVEISGDWQSVTQTVALIELIPHRISLKEFNLKKEENSWFSSISLSVLTKE
ncbi:MAG: type 4a pilus biogenesis protein PilO [Patescibacteria group bacterium]